MKWYVNSNRGEILPVEVWQDEVVSLSVEIDATGADCLGIHDTAYSHPSLSEPMEFLVRRVDVEREERRAADERKKQTTAVSPPPGKEPNRTLRRRETKHPWFEICGEIARCCIDPKTQRVEVPTNETKLGEAILQWCSDTLEREPAESEVREAVRIICAALRKI
jgi:hypothetical protein